MSEDAPLLGGPTSAPAGFGPPDNYSSMAGAGPAGPADSAPPYNEKSPSAPPGDGGYGSDDGGDGGDDADAPPEYEEILPRNDAPPEYDFAAVQTVSIARDTLLPINPLTGERNPDAVFTVQDAIAAIEAWAAETYFRRRGISSSLDIWKFNPSVSYFTTVDTFTERRRVLADYEPYLGGPIDDVGMPPHPWDIIVPAPPLFEDSSYTVVIPHTDEVRICFRCNGRGRVTCSRCSGRGTVSCSGCSGRGYNTRTGSDTISDSYGDTATVTYTENVTCGSCGGSGRQRCGTCHGDGQVTCPACMGACKLKHFNKCQVIWENAIQDRCVQLVDEPTDNVIPKDKLLMAEGVEIHREESAKLDGNQTRVNCMVSDSTNAMLDYSRNFYGRGMELSESGSGVGGDIDVRADLVAGASGNLASGVLLRQRISTTAIPVYEVVWQPTNQNKPKEKVFVYGAERSIHAPNYPLSRPRVAGVIAVCVVLFVLFCLIAWGLSRA